MENKHRWIINKNDRFVATLVMDTDGVSMPILVVCKNQKGFTSLPCDRVSFICPIDVTYEEADLYIKDTYGNIASDELEDLRLEYACNQFKKNYFDQMYQMLNFFTK